MRRFAITIAHIDVRFEPNVIQYILYVRFFPVLLIANNEFSLRHVAASLVQPEECR